MDLGKRALRFTFFSLWAVMMTALTYVVGAVGLKVIRREWGRLPYWSSGLALSGLLYAGNLRPLGLAFLSLVLLIGIFSEIEEMGLSVMVSGFFTLLINSMLGAGSFALWVYYTGPKWSQQLQDILQTMLKPLVDINPKLQISYYDLMLQLPSVVLILWMVAIYLAVWLENRLAPNDSLTTKDQLSRVSMPDPVVWMFIIALLGAFGGHGLGALEAMSVNILNVCFMLFFFQGIAVVAKFFESVRMGLFWQFMFTVLIIVHLFLLVSLLGLIDYWVDFRSRIEKRGNQEMNRET